MKKIFLTSITAVMATFAANASVAPYVSLRGGYDSAKFVLSSDTMESMEQDIIARSAYDVSGAVGVKYNMTSSLGIRGEIEHDFADARHVGEKSYSPSVDWARANTLLANVYLDFKTSMGLNPYFSAGIGYQWLHHSGAEDYTKDFNNLAYQFGGGISYDINKHIAVDLGYRYLINNGGKYPFFSQENKLNPVFHQFRLGATYTF